MPDLWWLDTQQVKYTLCLASFIKQTFDTFTLWKGKIGGSGMFKVEKK